MPLFNALFNVPFNAPCKVIVAAALILSGCEDYREPQNSLEVATEGMRAAALADDGRFAIIGSLYHGGSLWRTEDGERLFNWNHAKGEQSVLLTADFAPNGNWAITTDTSSTLVLWNTTSGEAERFWATPGEVLSVSLDKGGEHALLGLKTNHAVLFDVRRGGILHRLPHGAPVNSVALSENGRYALTGSDDYHARFWDLTSGEQLTDIKHDNDVQLVTLSPDGSLALSVSQYDKALLWHTASGDIVGEIPLRAERLKRGLHFTAAALSRDNRYLLTGRPGGIVELWDTSSLKQIEQWQLPKRDVWRPAGVTVLDVAFADKGFYAIASNGFIHFLKTKKPAIN